MASSDNRHSTRIGIVIDIKLIMEDGSEYVYESRNLSDTGIFLEVKDGKTYEMDTVVTLVVHAALGDEPPQPIKSRIVRITPEGIALKFLL